MDLQPYAQHVKATAKPGKRDELIRFLKQIAEEPLKNNPNCIQYLICTTEEPDVVWVLELWKSKQAKDTDPANLVNMSPEERERIQAQYMSLIVSMTDRTEMTVVGGKGA